MTEYERLTALWKWVNAALVAEGLEFDDVDTIPDETYPERTVLHMQWIQKVMVTIEIDPT